MKLFDKGFSDEALLAQMAQRDEAALLELHERYAPYLSAVARRLLHDNDEVQQCVQDSFVNAWDYAERFDASKASAKTWLVTICRRLALNRLRKTQLETFPLQGWDAPTKQPDHALRINLDRALEELDDESRELIELAFFEGHSQREVASVTGKPLGTVKSKLRRALLKLREIITDEFDGR